MVKFIELILVIFFFMILFFSGCSQLSGNQSLSNYDITVYHCVSGDLVSNPDLCPKTQLEQTPKMANDSSETPIEAEENEGTRIIPKKFCPTSCDDNDKCTYDYCGVETNFECVHENRGVCCGNGICEQQQHLRNECIDCLADCYACNGQECTSTSKVCNDTTLMEFNVIDFKVYSPPAYEADVRWFNAIESWTFPKIYEVYGFKPKLPVIFRLTDKDIEEENYYYYTPKANTITFPNYRLEQMHESYNTYYPDATMLEIHEVIHSINFTHCGKVEHNLIGEEVGINKIPTWLDEGLAMMMEYYIPYNYGNDSDKQKSGYESNRESTIRNFEDKTSYVFTLANNPTAYGYEHARGSVLLYSMFKFGFSKEQFNSFVSNLFAMCQNTADKINDREIIELWNNSIDRDDTYLFREIGIIN